MPWWRLRGGLVALGHADTWSAALRRLRLEYAELRRRIARTSVRARVGEGVVVAAVVALILAGGWRTDSPAVLVLQSGAAALLVPLRRILPVLMLPVAGVLLGVGLLTLVVPVIVYGAVRCVSAAGRRSRWRTPLVLVCVSALLALAIMPLRLPALAVTTTPYIVAYPVAMTLLFLVAPAMCGMLVGQRQLLLLTLRERNRYLERAQRLAETRSRLRERARIAQEMHDLLGHRLTLITLYAGGLELTAARRALDLSEEVGVIATTARSAMNELRDVLGVLRDEPDSHPLLSGPDVTDRPDTGGSSFEEEVRELVLGSRRAGLRVELHWKPGGETDPAPVVRRAVHRVVRESLTNVHKHAPAAAEVEVVVETEREKVRIAVRNSAVRGEGRRPEPLPGSGSGLVGLEERVRLLGGTLRHGHDHSGGFVVEAELPAVGPTVPAPEGPSADGTPPTAVLQTTASPGRPGDDPPTPRTVREDPAEAVPGRLRGALGWAAALVVVLAGIATLGLWIYSEVRQADTNGDRYAQVRTGMTRAEVEEITGSLVRDEDAEDLQTGEPAWPRGADCAYALGVAHRTPVAYRYCFDANRLVEKNTYPVDRRTR